MNQFGCLSRTDAASSRILVGELVAWPHWWLGIDQVSYQVAWFRLLVVHHVRSPLLMKVAPVLLRSDFWICRRSPVETRPLRFASLRGQRRHQPGGPEDGRGFATLQAFLGPHAVRIFGRWNGTFKQWTWKLRWTLLTKTEKTMDSDKWDLEGFHWATMGQMGQLDCTQLRQVG